MEVGAYFSAKEMHNQRYREGQEDQLGALGLVVNIIVLWNTLYMTAAVERLKQHGYPVLDEDLARLSPLIFEHILRGTGRGRSWGVAATA